MKRSQEDRKYRPVVAFILTLTFTGNVLAADKTIVQTAVDAGSFNTLAAALEAADLVDALQGDGPFTVFAPTDDAFAQLPPETLESLLKPENKTQLVSILKYHVVSGRVGSADVVKLSGATTLNGQRVDIKASSGEVTVGGARVTQTDIVCSNGIIHVIDRVLMPQMRQQVANPRQMIEQAIAKGAPLYNAGHVSACASLYMTTAKKMLALEDSGMCAQSTHTLQAAVKSAEACQCVDTRAWTLRHAMDVVYASLR